MEGGVQTLKVGWELGEREGIGMQWMSMKCGGLVGIYMVLWKGWKEQYNAKKWRKRKTRFVIIIAELFVVI